MNKHTKRGKKGECENEKEFDDKIVRLLARSKNLEAVLIEMEPGTSFPEMSVHPGEEFKYVLEGSIVVEVGAGKRMLSEGCWLLHESSIPHNVSNRSKKKAVYLTISVPPGALSIFGDEF